MGVFDFVKEAGAKVGIGDSDDDKAESEKTAAEAAAEAAREAKNNERAKKVQERAKERKAAATKAKATEAMAEMRRESRKADSLEKYVGRLGIEANKLDIRFNDGVATIDAEVADQATREKLILAVGNAAGVETVHEDIAVATEGETSTMHVVVKGDTLWAIAADRLGDGNRYPEIFEANKPMLDDPNKIFVGQVLRIPGGS